MISKEGHGTPTSLRRNAFKRMLDLENKNKLNKAQLAEMVDNLHAPTSTRYSNLHSEYLPDTSNSTSRATTRHNISVLMPTALNNPLNSIPDQQISKDRLPSGSVITTDKGEDSATSSICHSPAWNDTEARKHKKQKQAAKEERRRKKEEAAAEARRTQKRQNCLRKPPPTNKWLSKPTISSSMPSMAPALSPIGQAPNLTDNRGVNSKRRSFEDVFQGFTHLHGKVMHTFETEERQVPARFRGEFMGGLKLKQAEAAAVQEAIQKHKGPPKSTGISFFSEPYESRRLQQGRSSSTIKYGEQESINVTKVHSWDSTYDQKFCSTRTSRMPGPDCPLSEPHSPILVRRIKRRRNSWNAVFKNVYHGSHVQEVSSSARKGYLRPEASLHPLFSQGNNDEEHRVPNPEQTSSRSNKGPPVSYRRQLSEQKPHRTKTIQVRSASYVRNHREQSMDRSISGFEDECRVSIAKSNTRSWGRSSSFQSRCRISSFGPPASSKTTASEEGDQYYSLCVNNYALRALPVSNPGTTRSPKGKSLLLDQNYSSSDSPSSLCRGMNTAATTNLSMRSYGPKSPPQTPLSPHESMRSGVRPTGNLLKPCSKSFSKPVGVLGDTGATRGVPEFLDAPSSCYALTGSSNHQWKSSASRDQDYEGSAVQSSQSVMGSNANSRPRTTSSEEHSTFDEFTTATTSSPSRRQSGTGNLPPVLDSTDARIKFNSNPLWNSSKVSVTSGACGDEAADNGCDGWRTALPIEPNDGNTMERPPGGRSLPALFLLSTHNTLPDKFSKSATKNTVPSDLQCTPDASKSLSTPELQALKHQTFPYPWKYESSDMSTVKKGGQIPPPHVTKQDSTNSVINPRHPTSRSEVFFPSTPGGAQYPHNPLPNIPMTKFPPPFPRTTQRVPEQMAKMFVICCSCRKFLDMPSKIYECIVKPDNLVTERELYVSGITRTPVKCPWCGHGMSRSCCEGWVAVVALRERLH